MILYIGLKTLHTCFLFYCNKLTKKNKYVLLFLMRLYKTFAKYANHGFMVLVRVYVYIYVLMYSHQKFQCVDTREWEYKYDDVLWGNVQFNR